MSDGDKGEAAEGIKLDAKWRIATKTYTETEVKAMIAAAVMEAADSLIECSVWCDSQDRTDASWHNGVIDARKHHMARIRSTIRPDAMAALEAYRDREVAKAEHLAYVRGLENSLAMVRSMRASDGLLRGQELICSGLEINLTKARAMIPEVKP